MYAISVPTANGLGAGTLRDGTAAGLCGTSAVGAIDFVAIARAEKLALLGPTSSSPPVPVEPDAASRITSIRKGGTAAREERGTGPEPGPVRKYIVW